MRIAIGGIASENSTFNSLPTRLSDFNVVRGNDLLAGGRYPFLAGFSDAEFIPTITAGALPGGVVEAHAFATLKAELLEGLSRAGRLDGLYLDLHGALTVEGVEDPEGDLIASARKLLGAGALISASLDLHGNVTELMARNANIMIAYRTAPHIDTEETRERAVQLLVRCLREGLRPRTLRVGVPIALSGDITSTNYEPMAGVYRLLQAADAEAGVLCASLLVGYCWADNPHSMATAVVSGLNPDACHRAAARIAKAYWDHRTEYHYGVGAGSMDECITWAMEEPDRPVFITDSGDNPTGGGVGDLTYALERLLARGVDGAIVASIPDTAAMATIEKAGVGGSVSVSLGGKLDKVYGKPLDVKGKVERLERVGAGYEFETAHGLQAVLRVKGVAVIVTERRTPFHHIRQFQRLGLEPADHKVIVVKLGYLQPELAVAAARGFLALTPGAICQDLSSLPYKAIRRPIFPLDRLMEWQPPKYGREAAY